MGNTLTTNIETSLYQKLRKLMISAIKGKKSFACWSLPAENSINVLITDTFKILDKDFQLETLEPGFIIAPFDDKNDKILFLKSDFYWNTTDPFPEEQGNITIADEKVHAYHEGSCTNTPGDHYLDLVAKSIKKIEEGVMEKVVPARTKSTPLPDSFDGLNFFLSLVENYPDAFASWYSIPEIGTWFGATPEILIEVKNNTFKTVALAGTQPFESNSSIKDTSWTQKEIEEQALVSRYIINCFKKIRLREFAELGPKTVRAGNLLHLKTEFLVDMEATNFPDLGSIMLKLLHPTSAICGMPLEEAKNFLKENEDFDRSYFSGYLGPVNMNEKTNLFVNLRCLQILRNEAVSYAGAGVTIDSDPAKEMNETEIKMNTLIRLLK